MKPSPKKSVSSKLKHRTKSSSGGSASASSAAVSNSNNIGNSTGSALQGQTAPQQQHQQVRSIVGGATATAGGSDTNSSGNDANSGAGAGKDKGSYKSYAGFSSRSVRTIWEQHDKQETEVAPDVYTKLAEDTTYKLWELANVRLVEWDLDEFCTFSASLSVEYQNLQSSLEWPGDVRSGE